jgi:hypothetical protein
LRQPRPFANQRLWHKQAIGRDEMIDLGHQLT